MKWYIVHAYSNFEKKVAAAIREQAEFTGLSDLFEEILVPTEEVVEVRRGRKVSSERKFFPGYVLVKMEMTDEAYHLIKNTPKVSGFLGSAQKPVPISDEEADRIIHQVQEGVERPKPTITFEIGEQVRVADGPFASFKRICRGYRRRTGTAESCRVHFWPGNTGRTGVWPSRKALTWLIVLWEARGIANAVQAEPRRS